MTNAIDTFKQYVPAEILAAFVTVNTLISEGMDSDQDIYIIGATIVVLMVFFVLYSLINKRFTSHWVLAAITLMLPFWCYLIAPEPFENDLPSSAKVVVSVVLVIVSLGLTLFAPKPVPDPIPEPTPAPGPRQ